MYEEDFFENEQEEQVEPNTEIEQEQGEISTEENPLPQQVTESPQVTEPQAQVQEEAERKPYIDFVREYPQVKEFPEEVRAAIEAGESPLSAYRAYENRELRARLAAKEQTEKNRSASVGSLSGDAPSTTGDAFTSGFYSALKG